MVDCRVGLVVSLKKRHQISRRLSRGGWVVGWMKISSVDDTILLRSHLWHCTKHGCKLWLGGTPLSRLGPKSFSLSHSETLVERSIKNRTAQSNPWEQLEESEPNMKHPRHSLMNRTHGGQAPLTHEDLKERPEVSKDELQVRLSKSFCNTPGASNLPNRRKQLALRTLAL